MSTASDRAKLEHSYRRLLRLQPPAYRLAREDELLGVLIDSATPGQARATPGETIDLLWSAARHWVATAFGANDSAAIWRVTVVTCGGLAAWMVPLLSSLAFHPSRHLLRLALWSAACLLLVLALGLVAARRLGPSSWWTALRTLTTVVLAAFAVSELITSIMTAPSDGRALPLLMFVAAVATAMFLVHRGSSLFPDRVPQPLWRDALVVLTLGAGLCAGSTAMRLVATFPFRQRLGAIPLMLLLLILLIATGLLARPARIDGRDTLLILGAGVASGALWELGTLGTFMGLYLEGQLIALAIFAVAGTAVAVIAGRQPPPSPLRGSPRMPTPA